MSIDRWRNTLLRDALFGFAQSYRANSLDMMRYYAQALATLDIP